MTGVSVAFALAWLLCLSCDPCAALAYLSSGFSHVKLNDGSGGTESFQIEGFYSVPTTLESFNLKDFPSYANLESTTFTLVRGKWINEKKVYFNGRYYLFFIQNVEPYGTWLLGDKLGIDSGIAYLRPDVHTLVPVDIESATTRWNVLKDGKWQIESAVRVVPLDTANTGNEREDEVSVNRLQYHSISYFHKEVCLPSVLLMTPVNSNEDSNDALFRFSSTLYLPLPTHDWREHQYPLFWNLDTSQWTSVTLSFVIPRATPVRLIDTSADLLLANDQERVQVKEKDKHKEISEGESSQIVHLVGDERLDNGWRLFLRESGKDGGGELEIQLALTGSGLAHNLKIKSLKKKTMTSLIKKQNRKIMLLDVGSYLWMWFHSEPDTVGESRYLALSSGDFLLKCIGKVTSSGAEKYVFEYHHSHRRVAMDRSVLSLTTSFITATWNTDINALEWSLDGAPLMTDAVFSLGPDPVTWLRDYLLSHEGYLSPGLSSCFMYHGGLSMPQQLIYAAEMVCVLIGAKPMTMIQYTSSSDHQWKFPLVQELTRAITAGRHLLPALASSSSGMDMQFNTYQVTSETLIFYRPQQRAMLHLLRPNLTAQALHIVPFPSEAGDGPDNAAKMDKVLREQIYNSWWNGYLLGYPVRFIDSYLRNFHTKLGSDAILQEMHRAQRDVEQYFSVRMGKEGQQQRGVIGVGGDVDLLQDEEILKYFATSVK